MNSQSQQPAQMTRLLRCVKAGPVSSVFWDSPHSKVFSTLIPSCTSKLESGNCRVRHAQTRQLLREDCNVCVCLHSSWPLSLTHLQDLAEWNRRYEARFGHIFIICASGKSAEEMLAAVKRRSVQRPLLFVIKCRPRRLPDLRHT